MQVQVQFQFLAVSVMTHGSNHESGMSKNPVYLVIDVL